MSPLSPPPSPDLLVDALTPRRRAIVELVAKGLTNAEIASALTISPATVRTHMTRVLADLQVTNRTEAAAVLLRHAAAVSSVAAVLDRPALSVIPIVALDETSRARTVAAGLTADLTNLFARWCWFPVVGHATGAVSTGSADALVARFVISGTLRADRTHHRLVVQVEDRTTGQYVWTERYEFPLDDVFAVEEAVCERVVATVYPVLIAHGASRPRATEAERLSARSLAHEGMALQAQRAQASHQVARARLAAALREEPTLVLGHFGLGLCAYDAILNQWGDAGAASAELAASVERCQQLAPHAAEGSFLAARYFQTRGQHDRAVRPLEEAIARNPSFAPAHGLLAQVLCIAGRADEGLARMRHAVRLGPRAFVAGLAVVHFVREEYEPALAYAEEAIAARPHYPFAVLIATASAFWLGDHARARTLGASLPAGPSGFAAATFLGTFGPSVTGVARIHQALETLRLT